MGNCQGPELADTAVDGAGVLLQRGSRVQTQYTISEGGDGRWYKGTVRQIYVGNQVFIRYDDGDTWTGPAQYAFDLSAPGPPGFTSARAAAAAAEGAARAAAGQPAQGAPRAQAQLLLPALPEPELAAANEVACPVCTTNKMDVALGCGHRVCGGCIGAIHARQQPCPVCRQPILSIIRLFN
eukprot:TRINITY_DN4141_c1_g2_i1.p1 TRINITY_DN4141_c1_g2~~TRINITY_DN4141_c1_g2_i1.p1  ORF type:complete len:201 (-),score=35.55 TRINITY_DN4141_c1_g2_i1:75-620(-)